MSIRLVEYVQAVRLVCRQIRTSEAEVLWGGERAEATDFMLPRKAASEIQGARTANRHR